MGMSIDTEPELGSGKVVRPTKVCKLNLLLG